MGISMINYLNHIPKLTSKNYPRPAASTGKLVHSVQLAPNHIFAVFFLCLQFLFSLPVSPSNLTGADTFMSN